MSDDDRSYLDDPHWRSPEQAPPAEGYPVREPLPDDPIRDALAAALPDVMDQATAEEVWGEGTDRLDPPQEWYTSPRELAASQLANLRAAGYDVVKFDR